MAKKQLKPAAEEAVVQTDETVVIDDTLPEELKNPLEAGNRITELVEATVLASLSTSLPDVHDGSADDAKALGIFVNTVLHGIETVRRAILQASGSVSGIIHAVKTAPFYLGNSDDLDVEVHSAEVIQAIRDASEALRLCLERFTIQDLIDEDALLSIMVEIPEGKELDVESFLVLPKAQLVFSAKQRTRIPVSSFFKSSAATVETAREEEEIPEFRWSWTDEELFAERKMQQMRENIVTEDDLVSGEKKLSADLLKGYSKWKEECKKLADSNELFTSPESGSPLERDSALDLIEQKFTTEFAEKLDYIVGVIRQPFFSSKLIEYIILEAKKKAETHFRFPYAEKPTFIEPALHSFFQILDKSRQVIPSNISSKYIDVGHTCYFRVSTKMLFNQNAIKNLLIESVSRADEDMTSVIIKHCKTNTEIYASEKSAIRQAVATLLTELVRLSYQIHESMDHENLSKAESADFFRSCLRRALECISHFSDNRLSSRALAEVRNAASFSISWNFRDAVLCRPLCMGLDTSDKDYLAIINNFYPKPSPAEEKKVVRKLQKARAEETSSLSQASLKNAWETIKDDALALLSLQKDGKNSEVDKRIQDELISPPEEQKIFECIRRVSLRGVRTEDDAKRYLAAFQSIIDAVPKEMTVGKDTIAVPAAFREHLQSRLDELSHYILSHCTGNVSSHGDAVKTRVKFANPFAGIMENAKKRREAREAGVGSGLVSAGGKEQEEDVKKDIETRSLDPLQEAMSVSDVPHENTGVFISQLFTTALESSAVRTFRGMVNALTQPHIEAMNQEMTHFAEMCSSTIERLVVAAVEPGVTPSVGLLNAVAVQAMQALSAIPEGSYSFLEVAHREAIIRQVCEAFTKPDIDSADLVVNELDVVSPDEASTELPSPETTQQPRAPRTPKLDRLHAAGQELVAHRNRKQQNERVNEARKALPEVISQLHAIMDEIFDDSDILESRIQSGDAHSMKILEELRDYLAYAKQGLVSRMQSSD